jgi:aryl-alcohol dehydrogenase-like predicted oxidoreductase
MNSRLALGTVQFGMPYGIANRSGQVGAAEAAAILRAARTAGIDTLDTAVAYRDSERRLGEAGTGGWRIVTKLPPLPEDCADVSAWARGHVASSLHLLGTDRLYGLLLHRSRDFTGHGGRRLYATLRALRDEGVVDRVGVSVYDPGELAALGEFELGLVQAPFNVFDRRLLTSGWMQRLQKAGTEIHVRSVFLQGLLLLEPAARPAAFARWSTEFSRWDEWLRSRALPALDACLGFALAHSGIARVVVGVDSRRQLEELIAVPPLATLPPESLACEDPQLINPSMWPATGRVA